MDERMRAQKAEEIDEKSRGNEVQETQNKVGGGEEAAAAEREADRLIKSAEDAAEAEGKMRASPAPGTEKDATFASMSPNLESTIFAHAANAS